VLYYLRNKEKNMTDQNNSGNNQPADPNQITWVSTSTSGNWTISVPFPVLWIGATDTITAQSSADEEKKTTSSDGCVCKKCNELYPYASPPEDGKVFICWGCSHF
jgi:hypothetical protein